MMLKRGNIFAGAKVLEKKKLNEVKYVNIESSTRAGLLDAL